ncbi:cell division protein FtsX [Longispora fulva]|uniref:Cell division protein FtsX n=1 Tax=Longispora fulva TaxID=619741 RepID=A0A8J7GJD5_9ACTN|nr:permease-like cell division protein FtsX [Longispora fulva]MBG6140424.1 cell division transport system permease protein [Longispora fulva]GIG57195.1 cell division protein FtsX [Longispora fulva]
MRAKYVLAEVMVGLWRNVTMTIAMIMTMAVSLSLLGASLLMFWQVQDMKDYFNYKVEVSIFLEKATAEQRDALQEELRTDPLVKSAYHESQEEAYKKFKEQFKDAPELVNATQMDALPESFRVKLQDPTKVDEIRAKYNGKPGVGQIIDQRQLLDKIFSILGSLQKLALIIAIVQGVAALLLVGNTIQVAAYSKRREVSIMRLVGASNWFIQAPFVMEAAFAGIIGAVLAYIVLVLARWLLLGGALKPLMNATIITPIPWENIHLMLPLLAVVAGVINALVGWITLRFYIKV